MFYEVGFEVRGLLALMRKDTAVLRLRKCSAKRKDGLTAM